MTVTSQEEDIRRSNGMSMTYSDFPYYLNQGVDSDQNDLGLTSPLPREFQIIQESRVPLLQNADEVNKDFIILAEFSELEGPIPLCTIPTNAPEKTDVNLNNFAVHLMSTDYQVNLIGQFKICEDTQVLRKNVFTSTGSRVKGQGIHVFMQYFTLYDIKARGFVRPFCFGYVSKDHVKLDRILDRLIVKFDKMTKVLKQGNRKWFAGELEQYLAKLSKEKENYIQDLTTPSAANNKLKEEGGVFSFETQSESSSMDDADVITLDQIAHQFSEIENILRTVQAANKMELEQELINISYFLSQMDLTSSKLIETLEKMKIGYLPDTVQESIESLNMPLVHPLKIKGESLRPLTTLGQLGTLHLVWKLLQVYQEHKEDLIFSEMTQLSQDFKRHCAAQQSSSNSKLKAEAKEENGSSSSSTYTERTLQELPLSRSEADSEGTNNGSDFEKDLGLIIILNPEVSIVLEKIHASVPVPAVSESQSGSYHTISEEESDALGPASPSQSQIEQNMPSTSRAGVSPVSDTNPLQPFGTSPNSSPGTDSSNKSNKAASTSSLGPLSRYSLSSFTSEDEDPASSPTSSLTIQSTSESTTIQKQSWWAYISTCNLSRGQPGYGLLNFFRHYHKVAHHILYSILLGRPIIICGKEEHRAKVERLVNALIPLIPSLSDWKLLKWHRGILVQDHLKEFKLIGLCIPERLELQDLIHPRDENFVTILNVEKKLILGPAYSGTFLNSFESLVQKNFYKSDVAMLSFVGTIYTEIETKIFLFKSLEEKNGTKNKVNFKQVGLRASDIDIVKHLGGLIPSPDFAMNIF